jgi:hypothetical protein
MRRTINQGLHRPGAGGDAPRSAQPIDSYDVLRWLRVMLLATVEPFPHRRVVRRVAAHNPPDAMYSVFYINWRGRREPGDLIAATP